MKTSYHLLFIPSLVLLTAVALPAMPISDLQDLVIRGGIEIEEDSNILANSLEIDDTLIKPSLNATYTNYSGIIATELSVGVDVARYIDNDVLNYEDYNIFGSISYPNRVSGAVSYDLEASYVERTTAVLEEGLQVETNFMTLGGFIEIPFSEKFATAFMGSAEKRDARTEGFEDEDILSFGVEVKYIYSVKLDLFAGYRYRTTEIEGLSNRVKFDSTDHAFSIGARGDFSDKVTGQISGGLQKRDFDGDDYESNDLPFVDVSLIWKPVDKTSITVSVVSDYNSTGSGLSTEITTFSFDWKQTFNDKFSGSALFTYSDGTYQNLAKVTRDDQQTNVGARLEYIFAKTGTVYLLGNFGKRSSDNAFFDYNRNRLSLGVDYSF